MYFLTIIRAILRYCKCFLCRVIVGRKNLQYLGIVAILIKYFAFSEGIPMKKIFTWLLVMAIAVSLLGCGASSAQPEQTAPAEAATEVTAQTQAATEAPEQTEEALLEGSLFLKVSAITFSVVGETDDIYLGMIPREEVTWESEDPAVVSVENGVLTANGVGSTIIRATYGDQQVEITAGCLAQNQEELLQLDPEVLTAPKRMAPVVDLEEPCSYFDNAAMMGDSITYFLWQVESQNNYMGDVQFITRHGVSIQGLVREFKNLYFQGKEMLVQDIAAKCGAQRLYIMLGCLDFQVSSASQQLAQNWNILVDKILSKSPDMEIVIISNIPCYTEEPAFAEYNQKVAAAAVELKQMAMDRGFGYIDLGYYIQDHYGNMPAVYSRDTYHMNPDGSVEWMKIMRHYARFEQEGGSLK